MTNERFDKRRQGAPHIDAIGANVNSSNHDLAVSLSQRRRFGDQLCRRTGSVRSASESRRAEGAMLIAAVLNPQKTTRTGLSPVRLSHRSMRQTERSRDQIEIS